MYRAADGGLYTELACSYEYWSRLLQVFDDVAVLVRVRDAPLPPRARRVDGPGVSVIATSDFVAGGGLISALPSLASAAITAARSAHAFILHAPGVMATVLREALRLRGLPYGIEVVGDPMMSLKGSDPFLSSIRRVGTAAMREQVRRAVAIRYVSSSTLQRLYPPGPDAWQISASDVNIADAIFERAPAPLSNRDVLDLGFVGTLQRPYKGLDLLIDALARTALPHRLLVLGDGMLRPALELRARQMQVADRIEFRGQVAPEAVFDVLYTRDAVVQPSRTEGMPRALIEAMAIGLPCIATPVGSIPELLDPSQLCPVDDSAALATMIDALAKDPGRRAELAHANRRRAWEYRSSETARRLQAFYTAVRDLSGLQSRRRRSR